MGFRRGSPRYFSLECLFHGPCSDILRRTGCWCHFSAPRGGCEPGSQPVPTCTMYACHSVGVHSLQRFVSETAAGRSVLRATWWVAGMLSSSSFYRPVGWCVGGCGLRLCTFWDDCGFRLRSSLSKVGVQHYQSTMFSTSSKTSTVPIPKSTSAQFSQLQHGTGYSTSIWAKFASVGMHNVLTIDSIRPLAEYRPLPTSAFASEPPFTW